MDSPDSSDRPPGDVRPDGCTLPSADLPARLGSFDDLARDALVAVRPETGTRARLTFRGGAQVAGRVRQLVAAESACCSFFTFTTDAGDDLVSVTVEVPADRADVLAGLVGRAGASLGAASGGSTGATVGAAS